MKNEQFAKLSALKSANIAEHTFLNHNKLIYIYNDCIGGKTGYTMAAGRCLVSVSRKNDTQLVCVSLSAPDDWNDHMKLYNWAFSQFINRKLSDKMVFEIPLVS